MGISGLLPLLRSIQRPTELKKFSGETLGVDAYGWLHRGAISCAIDLAQGKPTRKYVDFAMHRVKMAKYFGVTPYMVFDGDFLPSKAGTEVARAKRRDESRKAGLELLKAGKPSQAHLELQKAIDVTPEMARHLIDRLKEAGIPYVVAPYEADAQLVYLERQGIISGIISEDSDLLVFGAKRLLTKLDQHGQCVEINRRDFCACREISLTGWTDNEFRQMAIFSGCDYLDGINNMGLKTAYRMIRKYKTPERVVRMLQFDGKHRVTENYLAAFKQAELTFIYQRVYCPTKQQLVPLTDANSDADIESMPFIGADLEGSLAHAIAMGDVNPITKERIVVEPVPGRTRENHSSWQTASQGRTTNKPIDSYFKGDCRIPLGEMDRNCFSVEPREVANITMNGLLPRVFPLPRPYLGDDNANPAGSSSSPRLLRRRTESIANIIDHSFVATSQDSRRRTAHPALRSSADHGHLDAVTFTRPPKKARLCEDVPAGDGQGLERSRFFKPAKKVPGAQKRETYLMSDDSVEEALLSLPDVDRWNTLRSQEAGGKIRIFEENLEAVEKSPGQNSAPLEGDAPVPAEDFEVPRPSPLQESGSTHSKERASSETPTRPSLPHAHTHTVTTTRFSQGLPTPASSVVTLSSSRQNVAAVMSTPSSFLPSPLLTPLQRIGAQALQRSKGASLISSTSQRLDRSKANERRGNLSNSPDLLRVNPMIFPFPKVDIGEVEALDQPLGSEDQIIPKSDGENESQLDDEFDGTDGKAFEIPPATRLNLSRFLYAGAAL